MSDLVHLIVFRVEDQRYALRLRAVERVVHAVEVTPLPGSPDIVMGAVNVEGRVLPVVNIRRRFLLPEREIRLSDQFLIAESAGRSVILVIDEAEAVIERPASAVMDPIHVASSLEHFEGVIELDGGLVLIQDLQKFLSIDEATALDEAQTANG